ncbi:MAG: hypothetical protein KDD36_09910 [Flavobacteriales bacterium]|nr:hypothetical protein [Flavobacteriales bacterium]
MKNLRIYKLTVAALIFAASYGHAQDFSETKELVKSFSMKADRTVDIDNKYGTIHVNTWEKDSVRLEVTIEAYGKKQEDIDKIMAMTELSFHETPSQVMVKTLWGENTGMWQRSAMEIRKGLSPQIRVEVNYKVYIPKRASVDLHNRFGDVYLPALSGKIRVEVDHGDLRADELTGNVHIDVSYGKAKVRQLDKGMVKLTFGELILDNAGAVEVNSTSSHIEMTEVKSLRLDSRHDKFVLNKAGKVVGKSLFSDIRIRQLDQSAELEARYGDLELYGLQPTCTDLYLEGSYADVSLEWAEEAAYSLTAEVESIKDISLPEKLKASQNVVDKTTVVDGRMPNAKTKVVIKGKGLYIRVR